VSVRAPSGPSFRSRWVDSATALRSARNDRDCASRLLESFPCLFRAIPWLIIRNRSHRTAGSTAFRFARNDWTVVGVDSATALRSARNDWTVVGVDSATALRFARNDRDCASRLLESFPCLFRVIPWLIIRNRSHRTAGSAAVRSARNDWTVVGMDSATALRSARNDESGAGWIPCLPGRERLPQGLPFARARRR
jgi:hypothetical protein